MSARHHSHEDIAARFLGQPYAHLDHRTQNVARHVADRQRLAHSATADLDEEVSTRGMRAADAVAKFGGSWTFVGLFAAVMFGWVVVNGYLLAHRGSTFDPYPYILLNLFLSMLAAIQAPIILMSQNRQSQKDRITAEHDYEVNLKAELEIMLLHEKIDALRLHQWDELLALQKDQLALLTALEASRGQPPVTAAAEP